MSRRKVYYTRKLKKAVHLLFYRRHRKPGVKGWELKKGLGSDYPKVLDVLNKRLEPLDLQVKTVFEGGEKPEDPTSKQLDRARFYITLRGKITPEEAKMMGWRIDDIAGLAVTIGHIMSKKGKAPRKEVEELLKTKLPEWRVGMNLDRYIRQGYITEDDNHQLYLDWRTNAEVDQKELLKLLLSTE
ncbi:MAG: hypothetical protein ACOC6H_00280 [Thermoproteota archaeon]